MDFLHDNLFIIGAQGNSLIFVKNICILMYVYKNTIYSICIMSFVFIHIIIYYLCCTHMYTYYITTHIKHIYIYTYTCIKGANWSLSGSKLLFQQWLLAHWFGFEYQHVVDRCFFILLGDEQVILKMLFGKHSEEIAAIDFPLELEFWSRHFFIRISLSLSLLFIPLYTYIHVGV